MTRRIRSFASGIAGILRGETFTSAVFWGAVVAGLVASIEYKGTPVTEPNVVRFGMFVGGIVAGLLASGSWRDAAKGGAYAGAITVIVLTPFAFALFAKDFVPSMEMNAAVIIWLLGAVFLGFPAVILYGAMSGLVGGLVGYIVSRPF